MEVVLGRVRSVIAALVLAHLSSPVDPAAPEAYLWRHVRIGGGGFITGYSDDRTGATRVIRTDVYGAYVWLAAQNRWAQLITSATMPEADRQQDGGNEGVFEIAVAPSDPDRLYLALKGRVYRSDNRGASFSRTSPVGSDLLAFDPNSEFRNYGPFMSVDPANSALILFGTPENGLWRSENAGLAWSRIVTVPPSADLRSAPGIQAPGIVVWFEPAAVGQPSRVWAMSPGHGVFVSSDKGKQFTALTGAAQLQPKTLKQGAFAPDGVFFGVDPDSRAVWRFRDGRWTNLVASHHLALRRFAAVTINPRSGQVFVFDEGGRTFRSSNGGDRWWPLVHRSKVGDNDPPWLRVSNQSYFALGQVHFDPVVADRLWADAGTGAFYADVSRNNFVVTWVSQSRGIEELVANDVIQPTGQAPLFAAWDFGIHRKENLDIYSTTYGPKERVLIAAQQMAWSAANPAFVVTNASDTRTNCCSEDGDAVLAGYSLDGGKRWVKFASLPQPPGTRADDPWRMSFGTIAVSAGDVDNIVWAPSFHRSPYVTRDRGVTWQRVVLPGETLPFTGSHSALHFQRKTLTADRIEPGVFYLVHSGDGQNARLAGLWVTRDGGSRWTRIFAGEIAPASQYAAKLRAVPGHAGHLFFTSAVSSQVDTRLRYSVDAGHSWRMLEGVERVDDVAFGKAAPAASYPTIFISGRVGGAYGIWRSTDSTRSWQRVGHFPVGSLDQVTVMEGDPGVFGRVYVGYKGSGWLYGEPAGCRVEAYRFPADTECIAVQVSTSRR